MKLFKENFEITLPEGIFYYPCAGCDTKVPIDLFGELVNEMHFSDINNVYLPYVDCGITTKEKLEGKWTRVPARVKEKERKEVGVYDSDLVVEARLEKVKRNLDLGEFLRNTFNLEVGDIRVKDIRHIEEWKLKDANKSVKIVNHKLDGILTLLLLDNISVFFYRNDTCDHMGTNQWWFSKDVFERLIEKLVDGAIIMTDGSNCGPNCSDVPWNVFWCKEIENRSFEYNNNKFEYLGTFDDENRNKVGVWKLSKN